jgi:hypothetical protein
MNLKPETVDFSFFIHLITMNREDSEEDETTHIKEWNLQKSNLAQRAVTAGGLDEQDLIALMKSQQATLVYLLAHPRETRELIENFEDIMEMVEAHKERKRIEANSCAFCRREGGDRTWCSSGKHVYMLCDTCRDKHSGRCIDSPSMSRYDCPLHL